MEEAQAILKVILNCHANPWQWAKKYVVVRPSILSTPWTHRAQLPGWPFLAADSIALARRQGCSSRITKIESQTQQSICLNKNSFIGSWTAAFVLRTDSVCRHWYRLMILSFRWLYTMKTSFWILHPICGNRSSQILHCGPLIWIFIQFYVAAVGVLSLLSSHLFQTTPVKTFRWAREERLLRAILHCLRMSNESNPLWYTGLQ